MNGQPVLAAQPESDRRAGQGNVCGRRRRPAGYGPDHAPAGASGRDGAEQPGELDHPKAQADLTRAWPGSRDVVRSSSGPWRIAWCAGAGVTGTTEEALARRSRPSPFLDQVAATPGLGQAVDLSRVIGRRAVRRQRARRPVRRNDCARADLTVWPSQAGGRAGARRARGPHWQHGADRAIANLYGPGQNLSKNQGLISHLCRANLTRQPLSVYVSMDTIRDYLYVDDCAGLVSDMLDRAERPAAARPGDRPHHRQGAGLGARHHHRFAHRVCRQVFKRAPHVVLGDSPNARFQVKDLRLRSTVWRDLDRRSLMPLPAGIASTAAGLRRATQSAGL